MGTYIGCISLQNDHFNFEPLAEVLDGRLVELETNEKYALFIDSELPNVEFLGEKLYSEDGRYLLESKYSDKSLAVFDFLPEDLLDNINPYTNERKRTGYKVDSKKMIEAGKISKIHDVGFYYIAHVDKNSNLKNDSIVRIDVAETPHVYTGDKVFIQMEEYFVGPYEIKYKESDFSYYVTPYLKENKYTLKGFKKTDVIISELDSPNPRTIGSKWELMKPGKDADSQIIDVISDNLLIESFSNAVSYAGNFVNASDKNELIEMYQNSYLLGAMLTNEIREDRLNRLTDILTSEEDIDETLKFIAESVCDLLEKYKSESSVVAWIDSLIEDNPEWINRISKESNKLNDLIEVRKHEIAKLDKEISDKKQSLDEWIADEKSKLEEEYDDLCVKISEKRQVLNTLKELEALEGDVTYNSRRKIELNDEIKELENKIKDLENEIGTNIDIILGKRKEKMVEMSFDGFLSSKMLKVAAEWEASENNDYEISLIKSIDMNSVANKTPEELINYMCDTIKIVRPEYHKNTIVNIAICLTQGFLTVFSGEPGCGKTSICNIFAEVLGLNKISDLSDIDQAQTDKLKRYIHISVEKGWTSKRDFVGYYNPLSKTFDKSNRRIYDALSLLSKEKEMGKAELPYVVLLDEANLSPMEYYWSDFMNICDDLGPNSEVNLGENYIFGIPETLHFLATINNDHTTEELSPRLVDRSWIVTLPKHNNFIFGEETISKDSIEIISWKSLKNAFLPSENECKFSNDIQKIYESILSKLRESRILVSPRVNKAIERYWAVASKYFVEDGLETDPEIIALDYAIAQRILPKIEGHGDAFAKWLDEMIESFKQRGLNMSADILKNIKEQGDLQMKYYRFFS